MLSDSDIEKIEKLVGKTYRKDRSIRNDLKIMEQHERITDVRFRPADPTKGWIRDYIEFDTTDVYYYSYSGKKRSKLGTFTIHFPLDDKSQFAEANIPSITGIKDEHGNDGGKIDKKWQYGPHTGGYSHLGGGGMVFKGNFKGFADHTREGRGYESYHPHVYGGGVELCLGGFRNALHQARKYDFPAFVETLFKFLREGGRHGDEGESGRRASMYSGCVTEIFSRNSEQILVVEKGPRRVSKGKLQSGLAVKGKKSVPPTDTISKEVLLDQKLTEINNTSNATEVKEILDDILKLL